MSRFAEQLDSLAGLNPLGVGGAVAGVTGMTIEAADLPLPLGSLCEIRSSGSRRSVAEVIGFNADRTLLMPLSGIGGVARGDPIEASASSPRVFCSEHLLGRVIDGMGRPVDELGDAPAGVARRIDGRAVTPMQRVNIRQPLFTGVRSLDALHTCGQGQRLGIFSGPGVGKSTLMSMIAKNTSADVSVVALIGERGREVKEFLETVLGKEGRRRCVLVVSTGEEPPLMKVRAARVACTIAEYFRDCGKHVLLMMDSLTRLAHAQRQIGLAAREPPAVKGFPPSVFALLPEILERAGRTVQGSVTGFYTVLVEGDDFNEPIPDAVKGITDGHLWLSRDLANAGHHPAIDVLQSISRVRSDVVSQEQLNQALGVLSLMARFREVADLVSIGAYVAGSDVETDLAVQARPMIARFLTQDRGQSFGGEESARQLAVLNKEIEQLRHKIGKSGTSPAGTR